MKENMFIRRPVFAICISIGIVFLGESASLMRLASIALIVLGIAGLKLAS